VSEADLALVCPLLPQQEDTNIDTKRAETPLKKNAIPKPMEDEAKLSILSGQFPLTMAPLLRQDIPVQSHTKNNTPTTIYPAIQGS
jgi:hypothetical protein